MIAFGGFSWAIDGAAAPVAAVLRLEPAMRPTGHLSSGTRPAAAKPAHEMPFRLRSRTVNQTGVRFEAFPIGLLAWYGLWYGNRQDHHHGSGQSA